MDPSKVVIAGDWHMNLWWATRVIDQLPYLLPDEEKPILLHCGDFGIWPGISGQKYLRVINADLNQNNAELWFVPGNHENWVTLHSYMNNPTLVQADGRVKVTSNIFLLPRNHRWKWRGKTWLAMGGAVSVDRYYRTEGFDVFKEEEITDTEIQAAMDQGPVDVMISHDCPTVVPLPMLDPAPAEWLKRDLDNSARHRDKLQGLVEVIQPELIVHGHYHIRHNWTGQYKSGKTVRVVSLDMDGNPSGNIVVCDVEDLVVS